MLYQFLPTGQPRNKPAPPPPVRQTPSPEVAQLQGLLQLLEWPSPKGGAVPFNFSTSPQKSHFQLWQPQHNYTVGDTLRMWLEARDHNGQPKRYGGDFLRVKAHSPDLKASVVGTVQDHANGTYTLAFPLLWAGAVQVAVRLIHSSEAVGLLRHIRQTQPSTVNFFGYFVKPGQPDKEERTECNVHPLPGLNCQYADAGTGELWFCVQPKRFPCSALVYHSSGRYKDVLAADQKVFFSGYVQWGCWGEGSHWR